MILLIISLVLADTLHLNLEQAKKMAIKSNPSYRITALSQTHSKLGFYEKLTSNILNPTVSVSYSGAENGLYDYTRGGSYLKGYSFGLSLNQPVFDPGEAASILQTRLDANAKAFSRKEAENYLYYEVESCYLSVLKTQKLVNLCKEAVNRAGENLNLVIKKVVVGEASKLDSLNAEVYLNRAKLDALNAQKNYKMAKRVLLNELGIYRSPELVLDEVKIEEEEYPLPVIDTLIEISLKKRPAIRACKEELKQSKLGFFGNLVSFLPQISFRWSWDYSTEDFPGSFSEIKNGAGRGSGWYGTASLNLFSYPFEVWKYKTTLDQTNLTLLNKRVLVVKEVKDTYLECISAGENLGLAKTILEAAEQGNKLATIQYNLGLIPIIDLLRAETDRLDAEITYLSALYDYRLTRTKLQYVTGQLEVIK